MVATHTCRSCGADILFTGPEGLCELCRAGLPRLVAPAPRWEQSKGGKPDAHALELLACQHHFLSLERTARRAGFWTRLRWRVLAWFWWRCAWRAPAARRGPLAKAWDWMRKLWVDSARPRQPTCPRPKPTAAPPSSRKIPEA